MNGATEIVLFHVVDPNPAFTFSAVPHEVLFNVCVRSIATRSPSSRITLLTDAHTQIANRYEKIESIRHPGIRTEHIMYERSRLYGKHLRRRLSQGSEHGLIFLDIDIIVNRDLGEIFSEQFDVGLTCRIRPDVVLDAHGIPANTQESPINGGVIFARPTIAASAFFAEQMQVYDRLFAEGNFPMAMSSDIRKWGGDQFALMAMVGREMMEKKTQTLKHGDAMVRFFDCEQYNYTPTPGASISRESLESKFIFHMKGQHKMDMQSLATFLRIA